MGKLAGTMAVCATALALCCGSASGAGIITHAWMADDARAYVEHSALKALLDANRAQLRSGAAYPDSGYGLRAANVVGGDYGEEAHWPRFVEAYLARLASRTDCPDLTDPAGPCAPGIAHLMGAAAHGMGDEAWDWLMEPASVDRGETYTPSGLGSIFGTGGTESQMDMIAAGRHHRPTGPVPALPSVADLMAAYTALGRTDLLAGAQPLGNTFTTGQLAVEAGLAAVHAGPVAASMPWSATHMMVGPGGVTWSARAIAAYLDGIWGRLTGHPVAARVSNVFPADGQFAVAATGWTGDVAPGTRTGRARTRIVAALSDSPPFHRTVTDTAPVGEVPAGAMTLSRVGPGDTETPVPVRSGYPRLVPYTPEAGEHMVDIQPAADLLTCTTYRVRITAALLDATGAPFTPKTWSFRTGTGADGAPCPDDPPLSEPVDPLSNPYEEIAAPPVHETPTTPADPPPVTTPVPPPMIPACRATSVRVAVRLPRGASGVKVTARATGGRTVKLTLRTGKVTVPLSRTGRKTTLTVTARVSRRTVKATKVLPACTSRVPATTITVKAPKRK